MAGEGRAPCATRARREVLPRLSATERAAASQDIAPPATQVVSLANSESSSSRTRGCGTKERERTRGERGQQSHCIGLARRNLSNMASRPPSRDLRIDAQPITPSGSATGGSRPHSREALLPGSRPGGQRLARARIVHAGHCVSRVSADSAPHLPPPARRQRQGRARAMEAGVSCAHRRESRAAAKRCWAPSRRRHSSWRTREAAALPAGPRRPP